MDRLDQAPVQAIKKLSTSRLISKLLQVGYTEDELDSMNRDTMLEKWATCVASGTDKPVVTNPSVTGYDAALEREKLDFETSCSAIAERPRCRVRYRFRQK